MITLAGHGKDDRLIQVELPIVPNVGDRIREDCNSPDWAHKLPSLIREGEFIQSVEKWGKTYWDVRFDNGKEAFFNPDNCQIIERAAAPVLVEKEVNQSLPEQTFKVGDRVYQENPDSIGEITKISRGKALVNVGGDRTVIVPLGKLHHCDPNYLPKAKKSQEQILAEEEAAIAKARDEYLKSQSIAETVFKIGDRVTHANELIRNGIKADFGTVTAKRFDKRKKITWMTVSWDDGTIYKNHVEGSGTLKVIESQSFKVGDRIKDKDGFIGEITFISDRCITVSGENSVKSYNLLELKNIHSFLKCLPTTTGLEALEPSAMQPESPAKSKQLAIPISAKTLKQFTARTSLKSRSLETLEKRSHQKELICLQGDSHVREPQTQEQKQDSNIQSLLSGLNISELSTKEDPDSLSSKTQLQLLITHCEQYLEDSEWLDISGTIRKSYKQLSLEVPKNGSDCLSLPTLTTNKGVKSRSSGQSKCEKWFRDKGLLQDTQCLSPQMMAVLFGFPMDWTKCLWDVQEARTGESGRDICLGELSTSTAVQQYSSESSTSIAVLVGTIVKPKFNGGTGKVVRSTNKKISVSWSGANNVVTYSIADFHNQIDILSQPIPSIDETDLANTDDAIATKPSKSVAISRMDEVLVGNNLSLDERLAYLQSERDRLIASGASPQGVWINCGKVAHRDFKQAVWKSDYTRPEWGDKKSKYIGEFGKEAHLSAIAQHKAGQELRKIERELKKLQVKS